MTIHERQRNPPAGLRLSRLRSRWTGRHVGLLLLTDMLLLSLSTVAAQHGQAAIATVAAAACTSVAEEIVRRLLKRSP
ncbi:hypothetical protein [Paractinoplanes durhamensis]|uniref:hypothetical protein n=1 Tax=Paractinoplanes durhamensis TaxID=113563 RepID=UPI001944D16F|nr:hypothetical protein [Actinoplanes durhamensis]